MAEEITYIPYGQNEISQQDLMTNLANGLPSFMQQYKWLQKPKNQEKFLKAYDDITKNLTGATDSSGRWIINVNNIDIDGMSPKDKEIYEHAAYYIQQQMSQMTPRVKEEEKKKEDLTPFNFTTDFNKYLLRGYGNSGEIFADPEQGWDAQDVRGSNGLRGTEKRRAAMIKALKDYSDSLEDNKYNFEGTQFTDLADAKAKIQTAINALKDTPKDESDDLPAFSALGLKYRSYFSNGGNDPYTKGDYTGTYQGYNDHLAEQKQAKQKAEQEKLKAQQANYWKNYSTYNFSKFNGRPLTAQESNTNYLDQLFAKGKWSGDEASQIVSAFKLAEKNGQLVSLSKEELAKLNPNTWGNRAKYLKKINGMTTPLYYDTLNKQYKLFNNEQSPQTSFQNVLDQNNPEFLAQKQKEKLNNQQKDYLNSTEGGFTPAEQREVAALLFDLGAAVDPEGVSSAGLSQIASGIRDYNRANDPEGWSWGDTGWAALDHGLGLLSLIPVAGGLIKGSWAASKLAGYLPKMESFIRYAGRAGATTAMATNASGALNTLQKIKNGEDLSLKDYQDLAYFFIGGLGHHQLNRGNRIERSAMKARGIETSNSILNKAGITRTKSKGTPTTETTPTLKVSKTDEKGKVETKEIPIDKKQEKILKQSKADKLDEAAKQAGVDIPEGYKITTSTTTSSWGRNKINSAKSFFGRGNSEIFGTPQTKQNQNSLKSDEQFEQYLQEHNNTWLKKFFNGSNKDIKRYDKYLGNNSSIKQEEQKIQQTETPKVDPKKVREYKAEIENFKKSYGYTDAPSPITGGYGQSGSTLEAGKFTTTIGGEKITFKLSKSELKDIQKDGKINEGKVSEIRGRFAKQINELSSKKDIDVKEIAKVLKKLKAKGWLKQGGQINSLDKIIEDFINNNNI